MRIIGGKHRGRKLKEFNIGGVRPTSDRAREALFNILSFEIAGSKFLDAFCGTGAIGLEAISRGATVTFVDADIKSIKLVNENISLIKEHGEIFSVSAEEFFKRNKTEFDIIFMDPPYAYGEYKKLTDLVYETGALKTGGRLIVERTKKAVPEYSDKFIVSDSRNYGLNTFDFLIKAGF